MNNKQLYKDTFDSFKMSEEALREVKNMSENNKKNRGKTGFRVAAAVAAVVLVFALGNGAVYAATGSAPVTKVAGKVIEHVSVYINGKKADDSAVKTYVDEDGNTHMEVSVDPDDKTTVETFATSEDDNLSMDAEFKSEDGSGEIDFKTMSGVLKQEGDKVFLVIENNLKTIDITEDFSDGSAEGKVKIEGREYKYSVSGTVEEYNINIAVE